MLKVGGSDRVTSIVGNTNEELYYNGKHAGDSTYKTIIRYP